MKKTFNEWVQYPNTEEAQHAMRFTRLKKKIPHLVKSGYAQKVKRIFVLMGFNKLYDMIDEPEELKQFEEFFNRLYENKTMSVQKIEGMIYPKYPPAPFKV